MKLGTLNFTEIWIKFLSLKEILRSKQISVFFFRTQFETRWQSACILWIIIFLILVSPSYACLHHAVPPECVSPWKEVCNIISNSCFFCSHGRCSRITRSCYECGKICWNVIDWNERFYFGIKWPLCMLLNSKEWFMTCLEAFRNI